MDLEEMIANQPHISVGMSHLLLLPLRDLNALIYILNATIKVFQCKFVVMKQEMLLNNAAVQYYQSGYHPAHKLIYNASKQEMLIVMVDQSILIAQQNV